MVLCITKSDFYCCNSLHSFRTKYKLKSHEKVCKNEDFFGILISSEKYKLLEFNQHMNSDQMPCIIYVDIESLIGKIDGCANYPENSSTTKIGEHILCGYSVSTIWEFHHIENKHTLYRGKSCMKKFCESLREHGKNINDFEKRKMLPLTKEESELKSHQDGKVCSICGKKKLKKLSKSINYWKVRDHCYSTDKYRCSTHSNCNLKFNVPNEIPVPFHNSSNYDYHFIINELAKESEGEFECFG